MDSNNTKPTNKFSFYARQSWTFIKYHFNKWRKSYTVYKLTSLIIYLSDWLKELF